METTVKQKKEETFQVIVIDEIRILLASRHSPFMWIVHFKNIKYGLWTNASALETLGSLLNKCLLKGQLAMDKLRKTRIDILWGMFYRENVDYPSLIWEDIAYQIDHRREKKSRRVPILHSTGQIPPKKSRGKGSQWKKTADLTEESVDVSDKSELEPLIKRKTSSRRVLKKKATISFDDNIVPEPDIALELGKSISLTKAEEEAAAR
ncbi:hypothetical protein Tco_1082846 [Tanacetum coccineum]|uniref:Uncharacterized protein n=1 Tax=Tanacetum coccineum TaxID=301880 RepID=A0ABQ5I2R1_9ASTR